MIIEKMLKVLPNTEWLLTDTGCIRCFEPKFYCPWVYAYEVKAITDFSNEEFFGNCKKVYAAADNKEGHDPELRKKLLEACSLL